MFDTDICDSCGANLSKDEIALNKKLMGLDVEEFYCLSCFADILGTTEQDLKEKIEDFKEEGCTLFS